MVLSVGWEVIAGAVLICKVAAVEISAGEHVPVMITRYLYPSTEVVAELRVRVAVVVPL